MKNSKQLGWSDLPLYKHYSISLIQWVERNQISKKEFLSHFEKSETDYLLIEDDEIFLTYEKYDENDNLICLIELYCPIYHYYQHLAESHGDDKHKWEEYKDANEIKEHEILEWSLDNINLFLCLERFDRKDYNNENQP